MVVAERQIRYAAVKSNRTRSGCFFACLPPFALERGSVLVLHQHRVNAPAANHSNLNWVTDFFAATQSFSSGEVYVNSLDQGE
jgi:hypothetical protein